MPGWAVTRFGRCSDMALSPLLLLLLLLPALLMVLLARAATPPEPVPVPTLAPVDPPLPAQSPDALFAAGAEAYARGDWPTVVLQMERALRARAAVRSRLVQCRLRCANATAGPVEGTESQTDPVFRDLWFFRALLRRAACLRGCGPAAPSRYRLGEELDREFGRRSPYNYLQVAYFKVRHQRRGKEGGREGVSRYDGFWDGRDARKIPESGERMDGWDRVNRPAAIPVPGRREGSVSAPAEWGLPASSPGLAPPPSRSPPTSATSELAGAAPVTALRPGSRGVPSAPRGIRAVSPPSHPDEPASAGSGGCSHLLRGQPWAPGDEAEPGVLPGHGGSPRG